MVQLLQKHILRLVFCGYVFYGSALEDGCFMAQLFLVKVYVNVQGVFLEAGNKRTKCINYEYVNLHCLLEES